MRHHYYLLAVAMSSSDPSIGQTVYQSPIVSGVNSSGWEVNAHPKGMIFLEHLAQIFCNALRSITTGIFCANTDKFRWGIERNRFKSHSSFRHRYLGDHHRIKKTIPNFRMGFHILCSLFQLLVEKLYSPLVSPNHPKARAITAIGWNKILLSKRTLSG